MNVLTFGGRKLGGGGGVVGRFDEKVVVGRHVVNIVVYTIN